MRTIQFTLGVDLVDLVDQIDQTVGKSNRKDFVRRAIETAVERESKPTSESSPRVKGQNSPS